MTTREDPLTAPHVVLFLLDDMRHDDLAWMPNVQRQLVDRGVSFTANYASYPLCCPSRASLLTGQYAHRTGVISNTAPHNIQAFDDTNTLGTWLTAAGYTTGFVGKYLNGYGEPPFGASYVPPGWTIWRVPYAKTYHYLDQQISVEGRPFDKAGEYSTTLYGDYAASFLTHRLKSSAPVYLQVNFVAPHSGAPADPDDPPDSGGLDNPYVDPPFRGEYLGPTLPDSAAYDEPDITDKPALGDRPRITRSVATKIRRAMQQRRDSMLAVDIQVKRIIDLVASLGQADNTLFVLLSDNGYFTGEHRITRGKNSHYEPASRVPLVVRGPGFAPGTVDDHLTGVHDVAPTVLEAAGASAGDRSRLRRPAPAGGPHGR